MKIMHIKLITGEELISKVSEDNTNMHTFEDPLVIERHFYPEYDDNDNLVGTVSLFTLKPWFLMNYTQEKNVFTCEIAKSSIITSIETDALMTEKYTSTLSYVKSIPTYTNYSDSDDMSNVVSINNRIN